MSSCLSHRFVFGVKGSRSNEVAFSDQVTIVYVAGHNIVIYNILEGKQRFIHGSDVSKSITAMTLCPSARFVALAEDGDKPTVSLHDLRTLRIRKTLQVEEGGSQCVSLAFSHDSNVLLTQGGAPEWNLVLWNWAKARQLAKIRTSETLPVYQVSFSPVDTSLACVCGNSTFQFYRVAEGDLRPMTAPRVKEHNFLCHTWLKQPEDHLVLGTETGQLLLFRSGDFVCYLVGAPGGQTKIATLLSYSQGFIAGCSDGGLRLYVMDHTENPSPAKMFDCKQIWRVDTTADVVSLALCPNEDRLCAVTSDNQLFEVKIITQHIKDSDMKPVISLFHGPGLNTGGITGMDTCVRKPLVATCGMDRTIRVWNVVEQRLDLWKVFQEEPYSLAMHPSGLHLVVGFTDKLRLMNLLMDDIRTYHEFSIKQCREVKFSKGGSMFAAVNGNVVTIFDFNTYDKLADLRGHNSKVRHLYWGGQDQTLVSCGQDGAVYQWDVDEAKRLGEFVQKGTTYSCALRSVRGCSLSFSFVPRTTAEPELASMLIVSADLRQLYPVPPPSTKESVFTVGNDRVLKELEVPDLQVIKELNAGVTLGQIVLSNSEHMMFAGTSESGRPGCVRAYSFPLTGDYLEYACVGTPVTRLCITHDDQFLLAADEASCLFVFDVRDRQDRGQAGSKMGGGELQPLAASEVTVQTELKNKVDELALHNEYQLRLKDMNYSEKIKEITEKFTQDLEQSKNKFDLLREEKSDLEMEYEARLREMDEKHQHELQELENAYQQKIMGEVERYQALVQERNMQQDRWNEQQQLLVTTHERYVAELTEEFEQKLGEDRQLRLQLHEEKTELDREFTETKHQVEDDIDTEIDNLRNRFENQLTAEREATLRYKGENGIMKKKFTVLTKDIEDQKEEIRTLHEKEKELQQKIKGLEREIVAHKREIKYRDDTIGEKEKKIYELKKKNQEATGKIQICARLQNQRAEAPD
ncbi:unnamed protein product [Ectocarpus sp. CCAP 1310/34]|nr:unnamed protein product [Ectocarpus sp. CCAP 1310/34]